MLLRNGVFLFGHKWCRVPMERARDRESRRKPVRLALTAYRARYGAPVWVFKERRAPGWWVVGFWSESDFLGPYKSMRIAMAVAVGTPHFKKEVL